MKKEYLVPPVFMAQITGVNHIEKHGNELTLCYLDGNRETAKLDNIPESYNEIVSAVQAKRK